MPRPRKGPKRGGCRARNPGRKFRAVFLCFCAEPRAGTVPQKERIVSRSRRRITAQASATAFSKSAKLAMP